jgi:hypothetical protein
MKREAYSLGKIFASHTFQKGFIFKIHIKKFLKLNVKKTIKLKSVNISL